MRKSAGAAFEECPCLEKIIFEAGSKLTAIDIAAFEGTGLRSITIPAGVETLPRSLFQDCKYLTAVSFEKGSKLKTIADYVFLNCGLTSFTIPATVEAVDGSAFSDCFQLKNVYFEAGTQIDTINKFTFAHTPITTINIPVSVKNMGYFIFSEDVYLTSMYVNWTEENRPLADEIVSSKYSTVYSKCTLYVPAGMKEIYETWYPWNQFENIKEHTHSTTGSYLDSGDGSSHYKKCTTCGGFGDAVPHTPSGAFIDNGDGTHSQKCSVCGGYMITEHRGNGTYKSDGNGSTHIETCADCGTEFRTAHTPTGAATDNGNGKHTYVCADCGGNVVSAHTAAAGYQDTGDGRRHKIICDECGGTYTTTHSFKSGYVNADGTNHYRVCNDCGAKVYSAHTPNGAYVNNGDGTHKSRCTDCRGYEVKEHKAGSYIDNHDGTHSQTCADCGAVTVAAHTANGTYRNNHNGTHSAQCACGAYFAPVAHECGEDGKCTVCGINPASDGGMHTHDFNGGYVINDDGTHAHQCTGCEECDTAAEHEFVCKDNGDGTHSVICVCGAAEFKDVVHYYDAFVDNGNGTHSWICSECGSVGDAVSHDYEYKNGEHVQTCSVCGALGSQTNHSYVNRDVNGVCKGVCSCGAIVTRGHAYGNIVVSGVDKREVFVNNGDGTHSRKCHFCGKLEPQGSPHTSHTLNSKNKCANNHNGTCSAYCLDCGALYGDPIQHTFYDLFYQNATYYKTPSDTCYYCGQNKNQPNGTHTHNYVGAYTDLGNGKHTQKCVGCTATTTSEHNYNVCTSNDDGTHTWKCKCGAAKPKEAHNTVYEKYNNNEHIKKCVDCGLCFEPSEHEYAYTDSENGTTHTAKCITCGYTKSCAHDFSSAAVDNGNGTHNPLCELCGAKSEVVSAHKFNIYLDNGDGTHSLACECGQREGEPVEHSISVFEDNGDGTHISKCACGYVFEGGFVEHTFDICVNNGNGTHKVSCACGVVDVEAAPHEFVKHICVCGEKELTDQPMEILFDKTCVSRENYAFENDLFKVTSDGASRTYLRAGKRYYLKIESKNPDITISRIEIFMTQSANSFKEIGISSGTIRDERFSSSSNVWGHIDDINSGEFTIGNGNYDCYFTNITVYYTDRTSNNFKHNFTDAVEGRDIGDGTHFPKCLYCDVYSDEPVAHSYSLKDNGDGTHSMNCICGVKNTEPVAHSFVEEIMDNGNGTHSGTCVCGAANPTQIKHDFSGVAVDNGDGTHKQKCTACDAYDAPVAHAYTAGYKNNGDGTHSPRCVCFATQGQAVAHSFTNGVCTACYASKLSDNLNTSNAATVYFGKDSGGNPIEFRVIGDENGGVSTPNGCLTLISSGSLGTAQFDTSGTNSGEYATSNLRKYIASCVTLTSDEKSAVMERTIEGGAPYGQDKTCNAVVGKRVTDKLWTLTTKDAYSVNSSLINIAKKWWMCSPGFRDGYANIVYSDGSFGTTGNAVTYQLDVRVALYLDTSHITSVKAVSGKTNTYELTFSHLHDFTGEYKINDDGTHAQKCTGCDEYGEAVAHTFVDGVCECGAEVTHEFVYSVDESGAKLIATCTEDPCEDGFDTDPLTLTLAVTDGVAGFDADDLAAWKEAGIAEPTITYYSEEENFGSTVPDVPGDFTAQAVIGEESNKATAKVEFTIKAADTSALEAAVEAAKSANEADYADHVWTDIQGYVKDSENYIGKNLTDAAQDDINTLTEALTASIEAKLADYSSIDELVSRANGLDKDIYTEESVTAFEEAFADILTCYNTKGEAYTQAQVDALAAAGEEAFKLLTLKHTHSFDETKWVADEAKGHYHPCTEDCPLTDYSTVEGAGYTAHEDDNKDYVCDVCGYIDLAAAKTDAENAINAAVPADASDDTKAVASGAVDGLAALTTVKDVLDAMNDGIDDVEDAYDTDVANAKEAAEAAIRAYAPADAQDNTKAAVDTAIADLDKLDTVTAVNAAAADAKDVVEEAYEEDLADAKEAAAKAIKAAVPADAPESIFETADEKVKGLADLTSITAVNEAEAAAEKQIADEYADVLADAKKEAQEAVRPAVPADAPESIFETADEKVKYLADLATLTEVEEALDAALKQIADEYAEALADAKKDAGEAVKAAVPADAPESIFDSADEKVNALADLTSITAVNEAEAAAEKQIADEYADALAAAKEEAKAAIDAAIEEDDNDEVKTAAEEAKAAIDNAGSVKEVENARNSALLKMDAVRYRCPSCGKLKHKNVFDWFFCIVKRVITLFTRAIDYGRGFIIE